MVATSWWRTSSTLSLEVKKNTRAFWMSLFRDLRHRGAIIA